MTSTSLHNFHFVFLLKWVESGKYCDVNSIPLCRNLTSKKKMLMPFYRPDVSDDLWLKPWCQLLNRWCESDDVRSTPTSSSVTKRNRHASLSLPGEALCHFSTAGLRRTAAVWGGIPSITAPSPPPLAVWQGHWAWCDISRLPSGLARSPHQRIWLHWLEAKRAHVIHRNWRLIPLFVARLSIFFACVWTPRTSEGARDSFTMALECRCQQLLHNEATHQCSP